MTLRARELLAPLARGRLAPLALAGAIAGAGALLAAAALAGTVAWAAPARPRDATTTAAQAASASEQQPAPEATTAPAAAPGEATTTTSASTAGQSATTPAPGSPPAEAPPSSTVTVPPPPLPAAAPAPGRHAPAAKRRKGAAPGNGSSAAALRGGKRAAAPSSLTPALPFSLESSFGTLPGFFAESFRFPPFLLPIYEAAGSAYEIPWQVLAAINEVETDYGRDLSVSSAGAEGWMQFLPAEWAQYGVDANGDGFEDPYNPADAIFAAARYLHAAGGARNVKAAVFAYNHSQAYVESVMLRAQLLGATPPQLLGAIAGLTDGRFPVYASAHFSDGFPSVPGPAASTQTLPATTIYAQAGAPVIAVQDGEIAQIGSSPQLGRFIVLRDAFGNTYTYAQLGQVAQLYPVLEPQVHSTLTPRSRSHPAEPAPSGPATAGAQPRSPLSEGAIVSGMALGAAASLEAPSAQAPSAPAPRPRASAARAAHARFFREGAEDVYLHPLRVGAQVIAGTVLGHVGRAGSGAAGVAEEGHILFQIRPAGAGAPLIDPKPILDGWVALENSSLFRARGANPYLTSSPSAGQVLLESKQQLEPQVLRDRNIRLSACGRADVRTGRVDKRVLALIEYLSVDGQSPTVAGLPCQPSAAAAAAAALNAPAGNELRAIRITAVDGVPVAGHQGPGSLADQTVRRLLMLQGLERPQRITSLMRYPGSRVALVSQRAAGSIGVAYAGLGRTTAGAAQLGAGALLSADVWVKLIARLGEIPDPTVTRTHSPAAIPDPPAAAAAGEAP